MADESDPSGHVLFSKQVISEFGKNSGDESQAEVGGCSEYRLWKEPSTEGNVWRVRGAISEGGRTQHICVQRGTHWGGGGKISEQTVGRSAHAQVRTLEVGVNKHE